MARHDAQRAVPRCGFATGGMQTYAADGTDARGAINNVSGLFMGIVMPGTD
jgi:hypothetical protein